jgi:hypothetical protein
MILRTKVTITFQRVTRFITNPERATGSVSIAITSTSHLGKNAIGAKHKLGKTTNIFKKPIITTFIKNPLTNTFFNSKTVHKDLRMKKSHNHETSVVKKTAKLTIVKITTLHSTKLR